MFTLLLPNCLTVTLTIHIYLSILAPIKHLSFSFFPTIYCYFVYSVICLYVYQNIIPRMQYIITVTLALFHTHTCTEHALSIIESKADSKVGITNQNTIGLQTGRLLWTHVSAVSLVSIFVWLLGTLFGLQQMSLKHSEHSKISSQEITQVAFVCPSAPI